MAGENVHPSSSAASAAAAAAATFRSLRICQESVRSTTLGDTTARRRVARSEEDADADAEWEGEGE